jgi:hypothetical protein
MLPSFCPVDIHRQSLVSGSGVSVSWVLFLRVALKHVTDAFGGSSVVFGFSFGFDAIFSPGLARGTCGFLIGAMFHYFGL